MKTTYEFVKEFKKEYPMTINWWRTKKHSALIDKNLNPGEKVLYAFAAQNDNSYGSINNTAVLAVTTDRLIIAQDRLIVGYKVISITPELYNDITINAGLIWGTVIIDTVKETIYFSNIDKRALSEIQVNISTYMMTAKKEYARLSKRDS